MHTWQKWVTGAVVLVVVGAALSDDEPAAAPVAARGAVSAPEAPPAPSGAPAGPSTAPAAPVAPSPTPAPVRSPAGAPLLRAASGGDGDSWRDTAGREYRLGLVDTPEVGDCFGAQATAERRRLVAAGFRAAVYATDRYGRSVAVVTTADGVDVNVRLARYGFADDRYLEDFRSENPALAQRLEPAFAAAREERRGLWGACRGSAAPAADPAPAAAAAPVPVVAAARDGCHPDYDPCVAVKGDGSGRGEANDLDCGDVGRRVQLRALGVDPYRLDADGDGAGCESS